MIAGSICSGIGAPECAWRELGIEFAFCSEIEAFPSAVLKQHYPEVPNLGDFIGINGDYAGAIDVLVGGTPCQDFSVAGLRAGMDGKRGQLTVEFARLAGRLRPRWLVWENVPGILSIDEGRAFGIFVRLLGELGYGFAYRILDAQYFGVAQRRRRVFLVGCLGDWRRAAAVLFERESLSGNPPPRREKGQGTSYELAPSIGASGRGFERAGETRGQDCVVPEIVTQAMSSKWSKGTSGPAGDEVANLVAHALRADGFDTSEDGTGRGTPVVAIRTANTQANGIGVAEDVSHTLDGAQGQAVAFTERTRPDGRNFESQEELAYALTANFGADAIGIAFWRNPSSGGRTHSRQITHGMAVRRLTPCECERLQGFPDDYTLIEYGGKPAADGPRYKALGNAMAVPVMRWIGERILAVEDLPGCGIQN